MGLQGVCDVRGIGGQGRWLRGGTVVRHRLRLVQGMAQALVLARESSAAVLEQNLPGV